MIKRFAFLLFIFVAQPLIAGEEGGTLCIKINGLKEASGYIGILIFNRNVGFPDNKEHAFIDRKVKVEGIGMQIDIDNLPFGEYAVAIVHDKNSNQAFDKNFLGIPVEPFGFTNNKSIYLGLPSFKEARIQLNEKRKEVDIKLINLL